MNMKQVIEKQLIYALHPEICQVEDESDMHHVPPGTESHFKVVVCSTVFSGLSRVQRHQTIYGALKAFMPTPIHALAIHAYSPEEWSPDIAIRHSPACEGGS